MVGQLAPAEVSVKGPQLAGYLALGPGHTNTEGSFSLRGSSLHRLAFVWLLDDKYNQLLVEDFAPGKVYLQNSPTLPGSMLLELFHYLREKFGPLPWPDLHVLVSNQLRRDDIPGFVFIHNPEEKGMLEMQWKQSHWGLWSAVYGGVRQWWGSALRSERFADDWLSLGINTWLSAHWIYHWENGLHRNLFAGRLQVLEFDYLQFQKILAAHLHQQDPHAFLMKDGKSPNFAEQSGYLYLKQFFALRVLAEYFGDEWVLGFLRKYHQAHVPQVMTPPSFLASMAAEPAPDFLITPHLALSRLWRQNGFSDFEFLSLDERRSDSTPTEPKSLLRIRVRNSAHLPVPVQWQDHKLNRHFLKPDPDSNQDPDSSLGSTDELKGEIPTQGDPDWVTVEDAHAFFDVNRFNNRSVSPALRFFPGTLRTLPDDQYALLWLPYFFRRPSEPFTWGLGLSTMKYLHPLVLGNLQYAPSDDLFAANLQSSQPTSWIKGGKWTVSYGRDYFQTQSMGLSFELAPLMPMHTSLGGKLGLKFLSQLGDPSSRHPLLQFGLKTKPPFSRTACDLSNLLLLEKALKSHQEGFDYQRASFRMQTACALPHGFALRLRQFAGFASFSPLAPDQARFLLTDQDGAAHRLDGFSALRFDELLSASQDLYLPIPWLRGGDSLVLKSRVKWRVFYDVAMDPRAEKSLYRAGGTGLSLPVGGSVSGAGEVPLLNLTALVVLYGSTPQQSRKQPSLLFDFRGEL
jgi:hypothetical protein